VVRFKSLKKERKMGKKQFIYIPGIQITISLESKGNKVMYASWIGGIVFV